MARALVVVRETRPGIADLVLAPVHGDHLGAVGDGLGGDRSVALGRLVALDHLQELEHRLVVLVLVGEQHLVDEPVRKKRLVAALEVNAVENVERALPHLLHVGA